MRILGVVHQFPPDFHSGTEILCLTTMEWLARRGHEVHVIAADRRTARGSPSRQQRVNGIDVTFICAGEPWRFGRVADLRDEFERSALIATLTEQARWFSPDIIHIHHFFGFGLPAFPALATVAPVIFSATDFSLVCPYAVALLPDGRACDGPDTNGENCVRHHLALPNGDGRVRAKGWPNHIKRATDRIAAMTNSTVAADICDAVAVRLDATRQAGNTIRRILVSSDKIAAMLTGAGVEPGRIKKMPHSSPPVTVTEVGVRKPLRIGFLGVLSWHKGAHVLVDAIGLLPADLPFEAIIRGDMGADPAYIRELGVRLGADTRVRIVDRVPFDRFSEALGEIDVLVVPSLWVENAPLVLLAALEANRYVVVSDMPGLTAYLPDKGQGQIVPVGDPVALSRVLFDLIGDPSSVAKARARVRDNSAFERYIDGVESVYRQTAISPAMEP